MIGFAAARRCDVQVCCSAWFDMTLEREIALKGKLLDVGQFTAGWMQYLEESVAHGLEPY